MLSLGAAPLGAWAVVGLSWSFSRQPRVMPQGHFGKPHGSHDIYPPFSGYVRFWIQNHLLRKKHTDLVKSLSQDLMLSNGGISHLVVYQSSFV